MKVTIIFTKERILKYLKIVALLLVLLYGVSHRIQYFSESGKDANTFVKAINTFLNHGDLYKDAIKSYENTKDIGGHEYSYFPAFLYLFTFLYTLSLKTSISYILLWKIPVLICDIGVAILLFNYIYKKDYLAALFASTIWFFNPYITARSGYSLLDPAPIFFILLSLIFLEKNDILSGIFYTLSVLFKPFGLIFLPLFLIKSRKWWYFALSCGIVFLIFSIPFITSLNAALTYLQGTIFVQTERVLQGRPFLFFISYYGHIELFQIIPLSFYSNMATFFGWFLIIGAYFLLRIKDKFVLASLSALNFYFFTPVLNRTYLIWFIPIFLITLFNLSEKHKNKIIYYLPIIIYWILCYWYLKAWQDGFDVWRP